jgi:hypothetical protein
VGAILSGFVRRKAALPSDFPEIHAAEPAFVKKSLLPMQPFTERLMRARSITKFFLYIQLPFVTELVVRLPLTSRFRTF